MNGKRECFVCPNCKGNRLVTSDDIEKYFYILVQRFVCNGCMLTFLKDIKNIDQVNIVHALYRYAKKECCCYKEIDKELLDHRKEFCGMCDGKGYVLG